MSTLIRTDQVPAADRLDFVREMTATTWVPMECRSELGDYRGEFRASGLGAMQVVVMNIMPITVRRTPQLISLADPDMLKMVLVCGGNSCVVAQDGRQAPLSVADFAIYDTRRPYEVACGVSGYQPTQMMTFMFPPSLLPLSRNRLGQLAAVRFRAGAGLGDLDFAVPPPAGPQCRPLQPGRGGAAVDRRAGGAGDAAGARTGRP